MAENKRSFILYANMIHTVRKLSKDQRGDLLMTILEYVNDQSPVVEDPFVDLVFEPIKQQLKIDLNKWEESLDVKQRSGKLGNLKRWNPDLYQQVLNYTLTLESAEIIAKDRKASHSDNFIAPIADNVNVNVNVNDTVSVNVNERENTLTKNFYEKESEKLFPIDHCEEIAMRDSTWVSDSKATPERMALFKKNLKGQGVTEKNLKDFKKHFYNWNKKEQNGNKFNGTSKAAFKGKYQPTGTGGY